MNSFTNIDIETYQTQFTDTQSHQLIDVREVDEYNAGHLPGAVNIPLSEFQGRYREISQDTPIVLVCAKGGRSAMAADFMTAIGYTAVFNLDEGTLGWMMRGLPLETDV